MLMFNFVLNGLFFVFVIFRDRKYLSKQLHFVYIFSWIWHFIRHTLEGRVTSDLCTILVNESCTR